MADEWLGYLPLAIFNSLLLTKCDYLSIEKNDGFDLVIIALNYLDAVKLLKAGGDVMAWFLLGFAITMEVIATTALKLTEGFTKLIPTAVSLIGYGLSFFALSRVLGQVPLAIAYAIWSGAGISLVGIIGWVWLGQKLDTGAFIGIGLIIAGVVVINVFSNTVSH